MYKHQWPTDFSVAFPFHCDSAHGWLQLGKGSLDAVGLKPGDFSRYSYRSRDGDLFYLEEDSDTMKFIQAYIRTFGKVPQFVDHYQEGQSFVRSLPCILV